MRPKEAGSLKIEEDRRGRDQQLINSRDKARGMEIVVRQQLN
jgi:hypothetical protein